MGNLKGLRCCSSRASEKRRINLTVNELSGTRGFTDVVLHARTGQKGAILVFTLIMQVALMLIALSAMDLSLLENMMSINSQHQVRSLSNAEKVLDAAEQNVETIVSDSTTLAFENSNDAYYLTGDIVPSNTNWDFTYASTSDGRFVIEYAGPRLIPGESGEVGATVAGSYIHLFLVDSQSEVGKGAKRNVQSVYITKSAP